MSRHGRHPSRSRYRKQFQHSPTIPQVHIVKDESVEVREASPGAMTLATDECLDDRPPAERAEPNQSAEGAELNPSAEGAELGRSAEGAETVPANSALARALAADAAVLPGVLLREQREARGLSLDDISRITKINKPTLRALEASDVPHLPAAIYTRGFVKAYAHEVGLDADTAADEYLAKIEPLRTRPTDDVLPRLAGKGVARAGATMDARHARAANQSSPLGRLMMMAAVIGLVAYVWAFSTRDDRSADAEAPASEPTLSDAAPALGALSDQSATPASAAAATMGDVPLRIEFVAQGPCWLSVMVDGERVLAKLLQTGERHTLDINDEAVLRIGDPGALSLSINGRRGRSLGAAGQPVNVRITKNNFHEFLSS